MIDDDLRGYIFTWDRQDVAAVIIIKDRSFIYTQPEQAKTIHLHRFYHKFHQINTMQLLSHFTQHSQNHVSLMASMGSLAVLN